MAIPIKIHQLCFMTSAILSDLEQQIKDQIRDIPDFPKPGIIFKDITPILLNPELCNSILEAYEQVYEKAGIDAIVGIESRGFLFGLALATRMKKPFVLIRKAGKLPAKTIAYSYDLEYGSAEIEIHEDAIDEGWKVLIHDDLLATGGTATAAGKLLQQVGAEVVGYSFLVDLSFLEGKKRLEENFPQAHILGLSTY